MRRTLPIVGGVIGVIVLIFIGLVVYAVLNLNSIIKANRGYILARASAALGRPVEAGDITASIGWGVMMNVTHVKVADDPAFSKEPFLTANNVAVEVEFLPLLFRHVKVRRLVLEEPQVRVIRNPAGVLNVRTIGKKPGAQAATAPAVGHHKAPATGNPAGGNPMEAAPRTAKSSGGEGALGNISIRRFSIDDGRVFYSDAQSGGPPLTINALNLAVDNFSAGAPFDVDLTLAALGGQQNLSVSGKVGPITRAGRLDIPAAPLDLDATIGPISIARLHAMPQMAHAIPPALSLSQPLKLKAKLGGTVGAVNFDASSDLSKNHVVYQGQFDKPAGVPFTFAVSGRRANNKVEVSAVNLTLATLQMKARDITIGNGNFAARIDTNDFDLATLAKLLVAAAKYNPSGSTGIHATVALTNKKPTVNGEIKLTSVAVTVPGAQAPPVSDLTGTIKIAGNTADLGPLAFNLGSGHAKLQATASSLQPLKATYQFNVDTLKLAELVPSRKDAGDEQMTQLAARGTLSGSTQNLRDDLRATTSLTSPSGMVANVPYQSLALAATYGGQRLDIGSLKLNAYGGAIAANGSATLGADPAFNLALNCANLDVQKAMEAQKAKAAATVRGILTGNLQVSGNGAKFDQIKRTLTGNGRALLRNGKLVGINVVAQALAKADNIPGIGALVPATVVRNHPELFKNPDTDIESASLTFRLQGPRITSHDIKAQSADYSILGDGWFDMDKNINLAARILLSRPFSKELVAAKRNVTYLTDKDGQVEIPLRVAGQLPKPAVVPDVQVLAQRAASHAIRNKIGGFLDKKGLGGIFGGGSGAISSGGSNPGATPAPANPLKSFKNLFR
ncbi:MAG: AsmA family protein [Candidatus Binataceae bacterium]